MNFKTYKIPCVWQCCGHVKIEAENLEDAIALAQERSDLPDGTYIEASFEIDYDGVDLAYPQCCKCGVETSDTQFITSEQCQEYICSRCFE